MISAFYNAKRRAKVKNIPFQIKYEDLLPLPTLCPVLGIPLCYNAKNQHSGCIPSIDRIKPEIGYVKGNVIVMSHRANTIKNNATYEEIARVINWMESLNE